MTLFGLIAELALPVAVLLMAAALAVITLWLTRLDRHLSALQADRAAERMTVWYLTPEGQETEQ